MDADPIDFNQLKNRPAYNSATMTGDTNVPKVIEYEAGDNIIIEDDGTISARGPVTSVSEHTLYITNK